MSGKGRRAWENHLLNALALRRAASNLSEYADGDLRTQAEEE